VSKYGIQTTEGSFDRTAQSGRPILLINNVLVADSLSEYTHLTRRFFLLNLNAVKWQRKPLPQRIILKRRPPVKALLTAMVILALSTLVWAQGNDPESCTFCQCLADAECAATACNAAAGADCRSRTFTVPCPGNYALSIHLDCTNGVYCERCCAETVITGPGVSVLCHGTCTTDDCKEECGTVTLQDGVTYTWYTCLRVCPDENCDDCNQGSCVARAWLRLNQTDTCPQPCN
jgi:hypothetical protein